MKIHEPQVSVIIPTYNPKHLLERAILSVLQQTFQDFELIVVDDASPNNSVELLVAKYPQIRLVRLSDNCGAAGARNVGILAAKGKFIAFLDHDDWWSSHYLERQIQALNANKNCILSFCRIQESDEARTYSFCDFKPWSGYPKLTHQVLLTQDIISTMTIVVAYREAILKTGLLNESLRICHDKEFYLRLLCEGDIVYVPEILATRFIHSNNLSRNQIQLLIEENCQTIELFFANPKSSPYYSLRGEARSCAALRKAKFAYWFFQDRFLALKMLLLAFWFSPSYVFKNLSAKLLSRERRKSFQ